MNLFFRLLHTLTFSRFRTPVDIFSPCQTPFRCWPTDLDVLLHMNNGKYFSLMDLARVDLMIRAKLLKKLNQQGWYPVVVAETIRFKKSLKAFDSFVIETQVVGWDEKAILLQQQFLRKGEVVCQAHIRSRFLKKTGGSVSPQELLNLIGTEGPSPELAPWLANWNDNQKNN